MIYGVLNPDLNVRFMDLRFTIGVLRVRELRKYLFVIIVLSFSCLVHAQKDSINYDVTISGLTSTGTQSPFWLHSRQYGLYSSELQSADLLIGIQKKMVKKSNLFDYGFKADLLLQTDNLHTNFYFHEIYAKARLLVFDFVIGSREEQFGNQDSTLSCGGFLFSMNARPMPKITIGIEHFIPIPFTWGYAEIKGAISHGWFIDNIYSTNELLHHKYAYLKLGGKLPVHIQYGIDHVAEWGGSVPGLGNQPTGLKDYFAIFLARQGGSDAARSDQINTLGNHIISQSLRLDFDISDFKIVGYWQNISEDGPIRFIGFTMNAPDGLWGISVRNKNFPFIKGFVYEYLNTTDQSGAYHDKDGIVYGGNDSYFSHGIYQSGWSYFSSTIGTPFIFPQVKVIGQNRYSTNDRVQVHHVGVEGDAAGFQYRFLSSFSKNYGSYDLPYKEMISNTSLLLEVNKQFPILSNIEIGCKIGADFGQLYGNSVGCQISIKKSGNLFHY